MDDDLLKVRDRVAALEGTVKWMKWCWVTIGGAVAVAIVSKLSGLL